MEKYNYSFEYGEYVIYKSGKVLRSPERGLVVKTPYEELAKRMVHDLKKYGNDLGSLSNIFSLSAQSTISFSSFFSQKPCLTV